MKTLLVTGWRESLPKPRLLLETDDRARAEKHLHRLQTHAPALTSYRILDHAPAESDCPLGKETP